MNRSYQKDAYFTKYSMLIIHEQAATSSTIRILTETEWESVIYSYQKHTIFITWRIKKHFEHLFKLTIGLTELQNGSYFPYLINIQKL